MVADPRRGFVPPPYPYDRLARSSGSPTPCPAASSTARSARRAIRCPRSRSAPRPRRSPTSIGYPPSAGSAALRDAAAAWIGAPLRRRGRRRRTSARASARRSSSPSLPHLLRLRNPQRDTVLYPGGRVPELRDGRGARRAAGRCRCRSTPTGTSISTRSPTPTPSARCVLWVNEPGNPTSSAADADAPRAGRDLGARARASSSRATSATPSSRREPATILVERPRRRARDAQRLEAFEPRGHARRLLRRRPRSRRRISSRRASTRG